MDKPFTTIDDQIRLLESRGVATDEDTASILRREGYYSVVNGYKAPFIDWQRSKEAGDDRYVEGTTFGDIHGLFLFDRNLREMTFHYLIRVEALVRTACAYCFSERHREMDDYLKATNYASENEYEKFGLKDHAGNLVKLTSCLQGRAKTSQSEFIRHYRECYGKVPLWVLVNDLTFGNIQHFFNLMKPEEQEEVCKHIARATGRSGKTSSSLGFFKPQEARASIDYLVKFRNNCAHDDRLYCAKVGPHLECGYAMMLKRVARFLPEDEYEELINGVVALLNQSAARSPLMGHLIENMGFSMTNRNGKTYVEF